MPDMEKVEKLTSILEERSGLGVREALVRYYDFLTDDEAWDYDFELDFLLNKFNIEVDIPFRFLQFWKLQFWIFVMRISALLCPHFSAVPSAVQPRRAP